ncbi:MAG: ATPase, T2SS/T4P/T4SS family, partial [Thermoleophilia bacterium]
MPTVQQTVRRVTRQSEERLAQQRAEKLRFPYANLEGYPASYEIMKQISREEAEKWQVVAYAGTKGRVRIGIVHPDNGQTISYLRQFSTEHKVSLVLTVISETSLHYMLDLYDSLVEQQAQLAKDTEKKAQEAEKHDYAKLVKTLDDLKTYAQKINTSELFDLVLASAINQNASDIHFEPTEDTYAIRFRIDGVLQQAVVLPGGSIKQLVSRIKMHANLKLDL